MYKRIPSSNLQNPGCCSGSALFTPLLLHLLGTAHGAVNCCQQSLLAALKNVKAASTTFPRLWWYLPSAGACTPLDKGGISTSLELELAGHLNTLISMQFYYVFRASIMELCSDFCTHTTAEAKFHPTKEFCTTLMRLLWRGFLSVVFNKTTKSGSSLIQFPLPP